MGSGQADGSVDVHGDREPHVTQGIEFPHRYQSSPLRRPVWFRLAGQPFTREMGPVLQARSRALPRANSRHHRASHQAGVRELESRRLRLH
jgi:hypothetical protein